jgi:hypothetical protein
VKTPKQRQFEAEMPLAAKYDWWWRWSRYCKLLPNFQTEINKETDESGAMGMFWKGGIENAAFIYELVRRLDRSRPMPPYEKIKNIFLTSALVKDLGKSQLYDLCKWSDKHYRELCDDPNYTIPIQFCLNASKTALEAAFKEFIASQREAKNFPESKVKLPRKNSYSWRWPEVWDMNELEGRVLGSSESTMKSRARKLALEFESRVLASIESGKKSQRGLGAVTH